MLYPLLFKPVYKDYIWGGNRIPKIFHRTGPPGKYAESWEVSDHPDGMSVIENGPLKGLTLHELFLEHKEALMGKDSHFERFPLLIKIIDAAESLSVQVHPNDETAAKFGGEAKTESWVVLEAAEKAIVYAGLKANISKEEMLQKLPTKEILSLMRTIPIKKGDVIFIPGGRLHAIGAGSLVFEVQQNSNTTYRVYDYDRGRPLHLEQAKKVMLYDDTEDPLKTPLPLEKTKGYIRTELIRTPYFVIEKWIIHHTIPWEKLEDKMEILFILEGEISLIPMGRSLLLPAHCAPLEIPTRGVTLFRVYLP
ncbi:MAG: mannose-6-phosphate isomerase [Chlamydiia bacterium]|nr:mannose-6-phosphate isomerase [Chlamydiia bacterium]